MDETSRLIKSLKLSYSDKNIDLEEEFPNHFTATFNEFGHDLEIKYERKQLDSDQSTSYGNIYVIDENSGKPVKYDLRNTEVNISINRKKMSLKQSF